MSTIELRNRVLERIRKVDEDYILEQILGLLDEESDESLVKIPEHYKAQLEKSIAQKEAGNTIPNSEVEKHIEKWLYK